MTFMPDDIVAAEKAADERKHKRGRAFRTMKLRDRGWAKVRDYNQNTEVIMHWHVPEDEDLEEGSVRKQVPPDRFLLIIGGKTYAFDTEEFRRAFRWV